MYIEKLSLAHLQNEEHFAFHTHVDELLIEADPAVLKIESQYGAYKPLLVNERMALDQVDKSAFTQKLDLASTARDIPIRGFFKMVKGMLHHFNPETSDAAYRIDLINESFSDITRLSDEKQTAATVSYLDALKAASDDITTLGLNDWVPEIEAKNNDYVEIKKNRFHEQDSQTTLRMKTVRRDVDEAYTDTVNRINAFITIDGDVPYAALVTKLNNRIDSFKIMVAQRRGRRAKADEGKTKEETK